MPMPTRIVLPTLLSLAACSLTSKVPGLNQAKAPDVTAAPDVAPASPASPASPDTSVGDTSAAPEKETEHSDGLPPKLVALVRETYSADPDRPGNELGPRNSYFDTFGPSVKEFQAAWAAYQKRVGEVNAAVAKAAELEKAGKLADARAALEAVITPATVDAAGKIDARARTPLDPRDAELPAIDAWVKVVFAQGDRKAVVEAGKHYLPRRKGRDEETELFFWLAAKHDDMLGNLVSQSNPGLRHEIWKIWDEAAKVRGASPFDTEGQRMAGMYFASLQQFGLGWTTVAVEEGKRGEWIMVRVEPVTVADKKVTHASTQDWRVPKRCWETDKVSWWDGNGRPVYEQACEYTYHSRPIKLDAKLVETAPAWSRDREMVLVVGKIESAGPNWQLSDAFIPDLRFSETGLLF